MSRRGDEEEEEREKGKGNECKEGAIQAYRQEKKLQEREREGERE